MSSAARNFYPLHKAFRLSPLVMALALISPFHANAAEPGDKIEQFEQIATQTHRFHRDYVLGTSLDVVVQGASQQEAKRAVDAIQKEIGHLDKLLSIWRDDSEITALNNNKQGNVSAELFEVIAACENWRDKTCGAFDARLGQLITLWEKSQGVVQLDQATRSQVLNQLKADSVKLDAEQRSIAMDDAVKFAPDAYAKGYIIDRALVAAREAVPSIEGLLVDIGGDIRVWGNAPQQQGWKVGVQNAFVNTDNTAPQQLLNLNDQAIAVSGQGYRTLAGQSHLLDPKTGMPLQQVEQCVVVGQCAADADALATALAAMTPSEGLELIEALIGYEAKLTLSNGDVHQTSGWNSLVQTPQNAEMRTVASQSSAKWPAGYQAIVDLTIPKIDVEKYRAPYVSVWVTDANKKIVRTLAVWGKDEKWINSNYVWYRRYGRQMPNLDAVAKPSRQPGHYKLAWDGKDETGKPVAAGKYLIHIETSREHGDHSYQTFDLDVKAKASNQTLAAQKEIGAVKLNFQKVN
ncbi:thiamine biosynthesis protein ApbE [Acinetobacter sp. ANC 4169]|uniref:DUF2271 domain-containing protein n=1 Tax=Acinetobacter sp. ANC 4169 TaxID=1977879 RepID=UPI000A32FC7E|nr:DUF2271 domain-containing protein [Acinetobacter sp. ANC 4169]OTG76616.1 thiamine biosynthesis protein ApbE [Acinetobacter sp. ANC 4169]